MKELIYSRSYKNVNNEEIQEGEFIFDPESSIPEVGYYRFVPMPERMPLKEVFIKNAVEFAEAFEIDIKIYEGLGEIQVQLSFDYGIFMGGFNNLLYLADDISFFNCNDGFDITMVVTYYTHKTISSKGSIITPYFKSTPKKQSKPSTADGAGKDDKK